MRRFIAFLAFIIFVTFTIFETQLFAFIESEQEEIPIFAGTGSSAVFNMPHSVFSGNNGELYVLDMYNHSIHILNKYGEVMSTIGGRTNGHKDGALEYALFNQPTSGVMDTEGRIFIVDSGNHAIRMIYKGYVYTLTGGSPGRSNGSLSDARFNRPSAIALAPNGNLYIADTVNNAIRRINMNTGIVTTVAGRLGQTPGYRDGARAQSMFNNPMGIALSADGRRIYIADTGNNVIRVIEGIQVTTLAEGLLLPMGMLWVDNSLMVADSGNHRVVVFHDNYDQHDFKMHSSNATIIYENLHFPRCIYQWNESIIIVDSGNNVLRIKG